MNFEFLKKFQKIINISKIKKSQKVFQQIYRVLNGEHDAKKLNSLPQKLYEPIDFEVENSNFSGKPKN